MVIPLKLSRRFKGLDRVDRYLVPLSLLDNKALKLAFSVTLFPILCCILVLSSIIPTTYSYLKSY